jgi:hypothetical protein
MKETKGTCPVCNGSGRVPAGDSQYKHVRAGYDKDTDTFGCNNCGGQYMYGQPRGEVNLNQEGVPCTHLYVSKYVGRCLTEYFCVHCADRYQIDSGD